MQLTEPNKVRTIFRLNMISTLFSSLNTKIKNCDEEIIPTAEPNTSITQPVLIIMEKTMPIFKDIARLWINDMSVIEVYILLRFDSIQTILM